MLWDFCAMIFRCACTGHGPYLVHEPSDARQSRELSEAGQQGKARLSLSQTHTHTADLRCKFPACCAVQDGAFLVRDSSKGSMEQPYTLMVLYQDKVFNIQIKRTHDQYLLGTGLKTSEVHQLPGSLFLLFFFSLSLGSFHHFRYCTPSHPTCVCLR